MTPSVRARRTPWGLVALVGWASLVVVVTVSSSRSPTRLVPERAWARPCAALPLGAGEGGVDLLAVASHATAYGLGLASWVTAVGFVLGTFVGTLGGMGHGAWAKVIARVCDVTQAFPTFLVALGVLAVVRSPSRLHLGLVFCLASWAPFARMALVQAMVLKRSSFVEAAYALGAGPGRVLRGHVLPNLLGPVWIQAGSSAAAVIVGEASLSFVGLGPADGVSLGALLDQGTLSMLRAPHVLGVAAAALAVTSGCLQWATSALATRLEKR